MTFIAAPSFIMIRRGLPVYIRRPSCARLVRNRADCASGVRASAPNEATKPFGIIAREKSKAIWRRCERRRGGDKFGDVAQSIEFAVGFIPDVRIARKRRGLILVISIECLF